MTEDGALKLAQRAKQLALVLGVFGPPERQLGWRNRVEPQSTSTRTLKGLLTRPPSEPQIVRGYCRPGV